jgi:serine/threonine protein kinase
MLGSFGEVMLMDWGVAAETEDGTLRKDTDQHSVLCGTPAYMAPEMALAQVDRIGVASDIYLLGAILYEMLTGGPPHTGWDALKCLAAAADNRIQSTMREDELVRIALKAMGTEPKNRYASVKEFQAAIQEYQTHAESILLCDQASYTLSRAEETTDYGRYDRALFGFQQSLTLWPENEAAKTRLSRARLAYAACAYENGDLDIAMLRLDQRDSSHAELLAKVLEAGLQREKRDKWMRMIRRGTVVAIGILIAAVTVLVVYAFLNPGWLSGLLGR